VIGDNNPDELRAKVIALLALVDVLKGAGEMSTVGVDRVGTAAGGRYAGKIRLKFSVFGSEARMMALADELMSCDPGEMSRRLGAMMGGGVLTENVRVVTRMIAAWSALLTRLVGEPEPPLRREIDMGVVEVREAPDRLQPAARLQLPERICDCELRNRQWNGFGRCLACGGKYVPGQ
jgi:hypothetical protein